MAVFGGDSNRYRFHANLTKKRIGAPSRKLCAPPVRYKFQDTFCSIKSLESLLFSVTCSRRRLLEC